MLSKKLSSDLTVIKKDFTRYAPVWCGLCALMVLVAISMRDEFNAYGVIDMPYFPLSIYFAPVSALAVFGYLHNHTESCAVHALPIRRERLFLLHTLSAFLMYLIPTAVFLIAVSPYCKNSLISMLLWSALDFAWLFSIAALCMMITGRKIGAALLYLFIQVAPILIGSIVELIYLPQLPGVYIDSYAFLVSPSIMVASIPELNEDGVLVTEAYIGMLVMVALTLAVYGACIFMYRKRHMERSGDLLSVKWLNPFFAVCSAVTGIFMMQILFGFSSEEFDTLLFVIGIIFGYLSYWMLSKKSARVFTVKIIGGLLALAAVLVGSVYVTGMDPFGRVTYFPEVEDVKTATLSQGAYTSERYETSDPECIAALIELHQNMQEHGMELSSNGRYIPSYTLHITYELQNGSTIRREYKVCNDPILQEAGWFLSQPIAQFGTDDPQLSVLRVTYDSKDIYVSPLQREAIVNQVLEECRAGTMYAFDYNDKSKWRIILTDETGEEYWLSVTNRANDLREWLYANLDIT